MLGSPLRHLRLLCGPLQTRVIGIEGRLRGAESTLSVRYVGSGASLAFLSESLFETSSQHLLQVSALPTLRNQWVNASIHHPPADMTIVERPPLWSLLPAPPATIRMPAWVSQVIHLPDMTPFGASALPRKLAREVARMVRRSGFHLETTHDLAAKREFYHRHYCPHVERRFGKAAVRVDEDFFIAQARHFELARLLQGDRWIAGVLTRREGSVLRFSWYGADLPLELKGASEVLDSLVIEKAAADGVRTVIFGHSRPSLADGVVRYKRRFGAHVRATRFPQSVISVYVHQWSAGLADRLNAARLIGVRGSRPFLHHVIRQEGSFRVIEDELGAGQAEVQ